VQRLNVEYTRKDDRGLLVQINTGLWKQVNYLLINKGDTFGGHYHKHKKELFYLLRGRIKVNEEEIKEGECFMINPLEMHAIYAMENSELIELLSEPYDKGDIFTK